MWICPKCEAMNKGSVCDICGEKKPISEKKKKKLQEKAKKEKLAAKKSANSANNVKKMSLWLKILLWVVSVLLVAGIAVGGYFLLRGNSVDLTDEDALDQIIANSREAMTDIDNLHFAAVNSLNIDHSANEGDTEITMSSIDMDIDIKNNTRFMTVARELNGEQSASQAYVRFGDNNKIDYYMGDGSRWIRLEGASISQLSATETAADFTSDFDTYFNAISNGGIYTIERKLLNTDEYKNTDFYGKEFYIIDSQIFIEDLEGAKVFGLDSFLTDLALAAEDPSLAENLVGALGPVYLTIYIDCETYLPMSCIVDMQKSLSALYLNIGFSDVTVSEAYCSMIYKNYNNVGDIVIPENVLAAPSFSGDPNSIDSATPDAGTIPVDPALVDPNTVYPDADPGTATPVDPNADPGTATPVDPVAAAPVAPAAQ